MHRPATIPPGFVSRLESTLAEREGSERQAEKQEGPLGPRAWRCCSSACSSLPGAGAAPREPLPRDLEASRGNTSPASPCGAGLGVTSLSQQRGGSRLRELVKPTPGWQRGDPVQVWHYVVYGRDPCGMGSAFSCWSYRSHFTSWQEPGARALGMARSPGNLTGLGPRRSGE